MAFNLTFESIGPGWKASIPKEGVTQEIAPKTSNRASVNSRAWLNTSPDDQVTAVQNAFIHQQMLQSASKELAILSATLAQSPESTTTQDAIRLTELSDQIKQADAGLARLMSQSFSTHFFNERHPIEEQQPQSHRICGISEVVESILTNLDAQDLVKTRQVSKAMKTTIDSSTNLKRRMFVEPDPTAEFSVAVSEAPGFITDRTFSFYTPEMSRRWNGGSGKIKSVFAVTAAFQTGKLPRLGDLQKRMLLCQPPIFQIEAVPQCCATRLERQVYRMPPPEWAKPVNNKTGITIGDLYTATERIRQAHANGPFATFDMHDPEDGIARTYVNILGIMKLDAGDPFNNMAESIVALKYPKAATMSPDFEPTILHRYIAAKRLAYADDEEIPTFAECKATRNMPDFEEVNEQEEASMRGLAQLGWDNVYE